MKIVLDCHYAPCINWWALALNSEEVLIEKHSFIRKGSYRNRCHVYGANGLLRLSIPIKRGKGQRSTIDGVEISYDHEWQKLHWESICSAYRSSPFFEYYEDDLQSFYATEVDSLFDYNLKLIEKIKELLSIKEEWSLTNSYEKEYDNSWLDGREIIHPNVLKDTAHNWVKQEAYIQVFESKQGYIENLSIFDLLFNLGPSALSYLQNQVKITLPVS